MKLLLTISFVWIATIGMSQQPKPLNAKSFSGRKLSDQWIYVKTKAPYSSSTLKAFTKKHFQVSKKSSLITGLVKVKVPEGKDPISFCNELRRKSDILYADPIVAYELLSSTSDPLSSNQYYLDQIKAPDAWNITTGDDDISIGIIDTGLDLDHEDIINNLWINVDDPVDGVDNDNNGFVDDYLGYDFADEDTDPNIQNGNHGMIVGGIAGASVDNGKGIAGVGYNSKVAALKGFRSSNGTGKGLYDAIIYAADNGIDVVNLSWGRMGDPLQSEQDIINYAALEKDMILVAAAGNEGGKSTQENKWYPASYDHVLSIGATDQNDNKSSGSSFNHSVDLVAPGVSMYSTVSNDGYADGGPGTSFASPQVAAAAALVKDQFRDLSAVQIMERIRATSDDIYDVGNNSIYDGKLGRGRLNVLRAVSEANVRSLRAENPILSSRFGETVFFGDTVQVTATVTNHLSAINDPQIIISSPDNNFTVSQGLFSPGFMGTGDTQEIAFEVILSEDISPETTIGIRLDYSGVGYNDFQFLDVTTSPDYADFGNENISMTISGNGNLGLDTYTSTPEGSGFQYLLDTLMNYAGLLLATSSLAVSDNMISNYESNAREQDFNVRQNYKRYYHPGADHFGYSEFTDKNRPLIIEQSNITWENENFLIIRYRIVNNSSSPIDNLAVGLFADWDLGADSTNYAEYDEIENYAFVRNASSSLFAAVQVLGGNNPVYSVLDMGDFNGNNQDINNTFNDDSKYDFLVNQNLLTAGDVGAGNDVASLNGITINQLGAYDETFVNVVYAIASSQMELETVFTIADSRLDTFLTKPRLLETLFTCNGFEVEVNPSAGITYEFYEDPLGQTPIGAFEFINVTTSKDTAFYVKNIDQNYPSDIFEVQLKLLDEFADFTMSTDTLYLDNPTTSIVQFQDMSLDAVSWSWDFNQGTTSTIQNPSLSFSEVGTYSISLSIQNTQGCTDLITKNLVVANRPTPPSLSDVVICPGENVSLNDPTAEKLRLYPFQDQIEASTSGPTVIVNNVLKDTTVYVSGIYDSFESERVPVHIDVLEVSGSIKHYSDTLSANHQIRFVAEDIPSGYTIQWNLDGQPMGSGESIVVEAIAGSITVDLEITSGDNCTKQLSKSVDISTSPFASQEDLVSCSGQPVLLQPGNGLIFGFYEDPELMQLIKKGKELSTNAFSKIYVVNLDDGLPGMPIEVNVTTEEVDLSIAYNKQLVGNKHQVDLSAVSNNEISNLRWYVNGDLTETIAEPIFFLDKEDHEIVLQAHSSSGCLVSDTLNLDFTIPLGSNDQSDSFVYPIPTNGILNFTNQEPISEIKILSLEGKILYKEEHVVDNLNASFLEQGVYTIEIHMMNKTIVRRFIVE